MKREQPGEQSLPKLGDRFSMFDVKGIVVADLAKRAFAAGYPEVDWAYLANGYLVLDDVIGLVHVPSGEDLSDEVQPRPFADDELGAHAGGLRTTIREELATYDGRSPTILSEMLARHRNHACFLEIIVRLAADDDKKISEGATWVLKSELEAGRKLNDDLTNRLIADLERLTTWQAQLHVCQTVAYLAVPENALERLRRWLVSLLNAERPFLRAWALDGLCQLPDTPVAKLLDRMADDQAASVRARVRNLRRVLVRRGAV